MILRKLTRILPRRRRLVVAAIAAAVCASAAGCSSSGGTAAAATGTSARLTGPLTIATSAPASATAPTSSASQLSVDSSSSTAASAGGGAPIPTGTQLATLFASARVPSGFKPDPAGTMDSKGSLADEPGSFIGLNSCTDLTNAGAHSLASDFQSSDAQVTIQSDGGGEVEVLVAAYAPGNAVKQMQEITNLYDSDACRNGYSSPTLNDGVTATVKAIAIPIPGLGDQAVDLKLMPTDSKYVTGHAVMIRVADRIIVVSSDSQEAASVDLKSVAMAYYQALTR